MFKSGPSKQIRATSTIRSKPTQPQSQKEEQAAQQIIEKSHPVTNSAVPFICTFCHHLISPSPPDSKPCTIGRSARLACSACYDAILRLAMCWVCGEVVVRGEDCVSLGWCFWHRACYGCLFCGSKQVARGVRIAELFGVEEGHMNGEKGEKIAREGDEKGKGKAEVHHGNNEHAKVSDGDEERQHPMTKEIDEVPLCGTCAAELNSSKLDSEQIAELGVSRIDKADGGLSRARWMQQRASQSERPQAHQQMQQSQHHRDPPSTSSLKERARLFQNDGSDDWKDEESDRAYQIQQHPSDEPVSAWSSCPVPLDSCIYVSSSDPLGEPTFKPSATKPIPLWMTLLSRNWYDTIPWEQRPTSILDIHFPRRAAREPLVNSHEKLFCPAPHAFRYARSKRHVSWERPVDVRTHMSEGSVSLEATDRGTEKAIEPPRKGWLSPPAVSYVSKEPLIRPSSRQSLVERVEVESIDQRISNADVKGRGTLSTHQSPVDPFIIAKAPNAAPETLHPAESPIYTPKHQPQAISSSPEAPTIQLKPHRSDGAHVISAHASQIRRMTRSPNLRNPRVTTTEASAAMNAQKVPAPMRSSEFLSRYPVVASGRRVLVPSDLSRQHKNATVGDSQGSSVPIRGGSKSIASVGTVSRETARGRGATRTDVELGDEQKDGAGEWRRSTVRDELQMIIWST